MSTKLFDRGKQNPECLSSFMVSRYVAQDLSNKLVAKINSHLSSCSSCQQLVDQERKLMNQSMHQPKPLFERHPKTKPGIGLWPKLAAGLAISVCLVMLFVWTSLGPVNSIQGTRTKGELSAIVSVIRGKKLVKKDTPLELVTRLQQGDQMRIRVLGAQLHPMALRSCVKSSCEAFYQGSPTNNDWLPLGLSVTLGDFYLELLVCQTDKALDKQLAELKSGPATGASIEGCKLKKWKIEVAP